MIKKPPKQDKTAARTTRGLRQASLTPCIGLFKCEMMRMDGLFMLIKGNGYIIKDVSVRDINDILKVYKKCEDFLSLGPVPFASEQMVLDDLKHSEEEGGTYCGVYRNGEMIGVIDFVLSNFNGEPNNAFISLLMIDVDYRRIGLGKEIVKAIETEILKSIHIGSILAGVQINNISAINFWLSMGYKIVAGPELLPDSTICYKLRKRITHIG
jgi:ribosomal protein S18 acetylase RimI-like enzyme